MSRKSNYFISPIDLILFGYFVVEKLMKHPSLISKLVQSKQILSMCEFYRTKKKCKLIWRYIFCWDYTLRTEKRLFLRWMWFIHQALDINMYINYIWFLSNTLNVCEAKIYLVLSWILFEWPEIRHTDEPECEMSVYVFVYHTAEIFVTIDMNSKFNVEPISVA